MLPGEYDLQFLKPAEQVARGADGTYRVLDGMGHILAFENPQRPGGELLTFLQVL